jgi:hypothetical protein
MTPEEAAAEATDPLHPRASPLGNLDNLEASNMPFSSGSRVCLGQVGDYTLIGLPV